MTLRFDVESRTSIRPATICAPSTTIWPVSNDKRECHPRVGGCTPLTTDGGTHDASLYSSMMGAFAVPTAQDTDEQIRAEQLTSRKQSRAPGADLIGYDQHTSAASKAASDRRQRI